MGTVLIVISGLGIFFSIGVFVISLVFKFVFLIAKNLDKLKVANKTTKISLIAFGVFLITFIIVMIVAPKLDPVGWCSHEYTVIEQRDATCSNSGFIKKLCSLCNSETTEIIEPQPHLWVKDRVIEATCSHPKQLINKCSVCGTTETIEEGSAIPHSFGDWSISIDPSADKEGQRTRECTVCKYIEYESLPKITYIEVTANDLWNAFNENEVAAEQKYNGKTVRVTGVISDINSGGTFTSANVLLIVDNTYLGCVQCNFDSENAKVLANLHKGESVTIEGTCGTISIYNLMIRGCKVIE